MQLAAVILAAGASDRMLGQHKLLLSISSQPMIAVVIEAALASGFSPVIVVTGFGADELQPVLRAKNVAVAHNPDWEQGMSGSIRAGIAALPSDTEAACIMLGDMPLLQPAILETLKSRYLRDHDRIVYPTFKGQQGHPVFFPARFFPALLDLQGNQGAKSLLSSFAEDVVAVAVDFPEIVMDCDTREDYSRLLSLAENRS